MAGRPARFGSPLHPCAGRDQGGPASAAFAEALSSSLRRSENMLTGYIDPGSGFTVLTTGGWILAMIAGFFGAAALMFRRAFGALLTRRGMLVIAGLALGAVLIAAGRVIVGKDTGSGKKVVVLGFDGMNPALLEEMMDAGKLPSFARLRKEGSYARMATTNPPQSPVAWASFATGRNPGGSGVYDFIVRDPKTYGLSLSVSKAAGAKPEPVVRAKRLWQYASDAGVPVVILGCPMTFPPDKVRGKILSGMGVPDILGTQGTFTYYTTEPVKKDKETGGRVVQARRGSPMVLNLFGPRVASAGGADNVKVPFKVTPGKGRATVEYQGRKIELEKGKWSGWSEVEFKLGMLKKARGILRFYLVETDPEFKLYAGPINFDPRKPFLPISYPAGYAGELAEALGLYHTQGMPMDTWALNEGRLGEEAFVEQAKEVLESKRAMLELELGKLRKGLLFCYFESPDIIQHMFWRYSDPKSPVYEKGPKEYREMIRTWYRRMDDVLRGVMDRLGAEDSLVVLSDHGFGPFRRTAHLNSWLRRQGYLELNNEFAEEGRELLADVDWSKTSAYSIGFGAIYLNIEGREGKGIVKPGEAGQLAEEIIEKLKTWKDGKNRVIRNVYRGKDIFKGEFAADAPDLYAGFESGYRASWQSAMGAAPAALVEDNLKKWSGSHLLDPELVPGILLMNREMTGKSPSIVDMAPTILKLTGSTDADLKKLSFDGKPLF